MSRLIDADALEIELLKLLLDGEDKVKSVADVAPLISNAQTVDAVPVVHGHWIEKMGGFFEVAKCSICGDKCPTAGGLNYCPNCGAKMDGEGKRMRLIDADKLIKKKFRIMLSDGFRADEYVVEEKAIRDAPTVDAVEVVRCKECIHFREDGYCKVLMGYRGNEDWFCASGRRK